MPNKLLENFSHLDLLAFEFFREFARSEYCLKVSGFRDGDRQPKADWKAFSEEVLSVFEHPTEQTEIAIQYYLNFPPKKQVVREGNLCWDTTPPDHRNRAELILLQVCRVRNNLFHGGKFNGEWFAPQRSEELLLHGLTILRAVISANHRTHKAFENRAG